MRDHENTPYESAASANAHPAAFLERYWRALANTNQALPARHDMAPRALAPILSHCFVLQRISPGMARFRLAGQSVEQIMGLDLRSMPFGAIFQGPSRSEVSHILGRVFDTPAIARMQLHAKSGFGRPQMEFTMLLCPLADESGRISRAIGTLSTPGKARRHSQRLLIDSADMEPVLHMPRLPDHTGTARYHAAHAGAFADPPAPFRHGARAHLRLVVDNG